MAGNAIKVNPVSSYQKRDRESLADEQALRPQLVTFPKWNLEIFLAQDNIPNTHSLTLQQTNSRYIERHFSFSIDCNAHMCVLYR